MAHGTTGEKAGTVVDGGKHRIETDSMGAVEVPERAAPGAHRPSARSTTSPSVRTGCPRRWTGPTGS